jgi:hypothetical protein
LGLSGEGEGEDELEEEEEEDPEFAARLLFLFLMDTTTPATTPEMIPETASILPII